MELDRANRELSRGPPVDPYERERRGRSPDPGLAVRSAVEMAELQDKLDKTTTELRRCQAELRLNQSDYDRSHVELEQMQEKVKNFDFCALRPFLKFSAMSFPSRLLGTQFDSFIAFVGEREVFTSSSFIPFSPPRGKVVMTCADINGCSHCCHFYALQPW